MSLPELLDRITAARKHAEGRMERATFQAEYRDSKELVRLLEDVRDQLNKPLWIQVVTSEDKTLKGTISLKGKAA